MSRKLGHKKEVEARRFLCRQGMICVTQNYTCKMGEIDRIMRHHNLIIFVEVKYRCNTLYGSSQEMVHISKQSKLSKTAWHFLQAHPQFQVYDSRFDIIAIDQTAHEPLTWIHNAFEDMME